MKLRRTRRRPVFRPRRNRRNMAVVAAFIIAFGVTTAALVQIVTDIADRTPEELETPEDPHPNH